MKDRNGGLIRGQFSPRTSRNKLSFRPDIVVTSGQIATRTNNDDLSLVSGGGTVRRSTGNRDSLESRDKPNDESSVGSKTYAVTSVTEEVRRRGREGKTDCEIVGFVVCRSE